MKLSNKLVEDVVCEVAGADVIPLVKALKNRKDVSEFKLASEMKQEINITRNMLYRLYDSNLVSFIRKKDKKKGWYIYYWTFSPKNVSHMLRHLKKKRHERLKERLTREKSADFYTCTNECIRLDFEQATDFGYKCPECGALLNLEDNKGKIESIKKEITKLEKDLKKR